MTKGFLKIPYKSLLEDGSVPAEALEIYQTHG